MRHGHVIINEVSKTQLSVARHFCGCTFNGFLYVYDSRADRLVRQDWWPIYQKTPFNAFLDLVLTYDTAKDAKAALRERQAAKTTIQQEQQLNLFEQ